MAGLRRRRPRTITGRLLLWHAVAVLAVLLALAVVADRAIERSFVDQLTASLETDARAIQATVSPGPDLQARVVTLGRSMGVRITVIRTDGVVLADSEHDPATMENHRTRPEVRQALAGRVGISSRPSPTLGIPFRYVALPPRDGRIVRVAVPLTAIQSRVGVLRLIFALGFGAAALLSLAVLALIARGTTRPLRDITAAVGDAGAEPAHPIPERGTEEVVTLARALNRMREEVTDRVRAMEQDRSDREAILSALAEGIVLFDREGTVLYRNEQAARLLGGRADRALDLRPTPLEELVRRALAGDRPGPLEVAVGAEGRTVLASASPLPGEGRALLVLRDVTEARRVEAIRRDFAANASHELKTPVASILALAETIVDASGTDPGVVQGFARRLEAEALRLSRIVSDLLDLSRLESGSGERDRIRLDRVVAEEAERHRDEAERNRLTFEVRVRDPLVVTGSARDLALLVRNLVENAIHYTRAGGRVEVEAGSEDGSAVIRVRDTGIGIPGRDLPRIFERFYRVDRARSRETGGTGLGLSIVRHVAENHGGSVRVDSALGKGSTFTVRLPLSS